MIPRDSSDWTMWDYVHMLARLLQHKRRINPLSYLWIIEIRAYEWRHSIPSYFTESARTV